MTVWHLSFSLGFSAAKVGVASANMRRPTTPTAGNDTLFIYVLFYSIRLIPTNMRQLGPSVVQSPKAPKPLRGRILLVPTCPSRPGLRDSVRANQLERAPSAGAFC